MTKKEQIIELLDKYGNETDIFKAFITKDEFSDLADDLVKLFAIPDVIKSVCEKCGKGEQTVGTPLCLECLLKLYDEQTGL